MCTHQGNEVFSSQLLITLQRSAELGRNLVRKATICTDYMPKMAFNLTAKAKLTGSNPGFGFEHGGHSGRETPEPFPNSEDKPVHVLYCTQVREPSGNTDRCHAHLISFSGSYLRKRGIPNCCYHESHSAMLQCQSGYCAPGKDAKRERCHAI